jgi:putative addiction module killer protein
MVDRIETVYEIETTDDFERWLRGIRDGKTQKIIIKRVRMMELGNLGETRFLAKGLFEAKIHYGPGFRLYFVNRGAKIIVLLCGGDKSTQKQDIKKAMEMAEDV